jgi:hypothetical protein
MDRRSVVLVNSPVIVIIETRDPEYEPAKEREIEK